MNKTKIITRTAVIIALAIIFQNLRVFLGSSPQSTIIIGSLVNLCIIVATGLVGIVPGIIVSLVTPIVALFQSHLPHPLFAPVTMAGNIVIALVYYTFLKMNTFNKIKGYIGVILGAIVKWAVMYYAGIALVLNVILKDVLKPKQIQLISANFNIPQIITALIGGILGVILVDVLKNKINKIGD